MLGFPRGFLWGAATAAHQIEGNNVNSDWWRSEQRGLLPFPSEAACDSWNCWQDDVRLLTEIGLNAYRMSVEWARIEPRRGEFDQTALDAYRRQIEALREAGIEPLVTLHHFTNPLWIADAGGWVNPDVASRLADYTEQVARRLGDLVRWWVTINEPSILAIKGYVEGSWPPHRPNDLRGYLRVMRNAARGHALARQVLKSHRADAQCGIAFALWPLEPARGWSPLDQSLAWIGDWFGHGYALRRAMPALDWIGVNYYSRAIVGWPPPSNHVAAHLRTDFGWEIYPSGLYAILRRVHRAGHGRPVVVTENGIADADDHQRASYIVAHVREMHRAISDGVDLRGYMHWTLLDNFEWAEGFTQRFGLATRDRQLRPSARVYGAIARANALDEAARGTFSVT